MLERLRRAHDLAHVVDDLPARRARGEVPFDVGALGRLERSVGVRVEEGFAWMHRIHGPGKAGHYFLRSPLSVILALNTCDLDVPSAMPRRCATSLRSNL